MCARTWALVGMLMLGGVGQVVGQCDRSTEAVALSIQWFDPLRRLNLRPGSPEVQQMQRTLEMVDSALPVLQTACAYFADGMSRMVYWYVHTDSGGVVVDSLRGIAALADSVRMICYSEPPYFGAARGGAGEGSTFPPRRWSTGSRDQCGSETFLAPLLTAGLRLDIDWFPNMKVYFLTLLVDNAPVDAVMLQRQLSTLPNVLGRFAPLLHSSDVVSEPWATLGVLHNQLQAAGDSGQHAAKEPIVLRYQVAWGDCVAGCIYKHTWTIQVKQRIVDGEMRPAGMKVLSEEGPPLTDEAVRRLP